MMPTQKFNTAWKMFNISLTIRLTGQTNYSKTPKLKCRKNTNI
ncbi:hypothetical protein Patl1_10473 [Pistacia atlantica]|uniref:Uncharacterized protein n=1 Tax=Pistacia atlantica TaxID=434234 RepID=A0ACC1A656_9ROSI|nr:hypothetical protein Patl1_10473 [Pistacia atlantica]